MPLVIKPLTDIVTFNRQSEGSRVNKDALMVFDPAGTPRIMFDQLVPGRRIGILIEESRTNIALDSLDPTKWSSTSISFETGVGIKFVDGITNVKKAISADAQGWKSLRSRNFQVQAGAVVTLSCFVKADTNNTARLAFTGDVWDSADSAAEFNLVNGTSTGAGKPNLERWPNGWFRCSISTTAKTAGTASCSVSMGGGEMYFCGFQIETGSGASSLIKTTTAQVTRAADVPTVDNLLSIMGDTECTVLASFYPGFPGSKDINTGVWLHKRSAVGINLITARRRANGLMEAAVAGDTEAPIAYASDPTVIADRAFSRTSVGRNATDIVICVNGGTVTRTKTDIKPKPDQLVVGSTSRNQFSNGIIARIKVVPKLLTDAQIKALN